MESKQSSSSLKPNKTTKLRKTLKSENLDGSSNQVDYNIEKRMKKDDSGISIEKSPSDSSDDEVHDVAMQETEKEVPTTVNKMADDFSGLNSPDSGNQDCCSLNDFPENSVSFDTISEIQSTTPSTEQVGDTEGQTKKSQSDISESKNSSEKNFNSGGEDMSTQSDDISIENKTKSEEDETNYDPTPDAPKPKHKWAASTEALKRQYGTSVRYSPDFFRYNCYGSLHMVERLELMYKMKKHDGCVNALNFNSSGTKLATGSDDLGIIIWDWTISEPILEYSSGHRSNVFQAKFMPLSGDCQVVSCARDGQVRIAELSTTGICKSTRKLAQHKGAAHKLAVQMDSPHTFLSCGEDAAVFEIDLRENKPEKLVICKENEKKIPLYSIFINPCNNYEYTTGGRDHYVRVYDKRCIRQEDGFLKKYCPEHLVNSDIRANVTCVVYNYSGEEILASFNDEDIYIFDAHTADTAQYLHRYKGHRNSQTVKGVNYFGPKSEYIISGSDCGYIFFWEKESEHIVKYMHGDEGGVVNCLEPNPNLPVLATSGLDDDIKIWVPSCEDLPDLSGLRNHIISNMKEREEERKQDGPETFDDHMLWFLMQHLRRARRRTQTGSRETENSSSSSTDSESHDDETEFHHAIQCSQS